VSEKSSSQSDSIFNSEGEEDDDSKESEAIDFDSEWTEANAIFG
jgi:hypothetical protein